MPTGKDIDLRFPLAGIDVAAGLGRQPRRPLPDGSYAFTCRSGVNVRAIDPATGRLRGGSRPGLSKLLSDRPWGRDFIVQHLNVLVGSGYTPPGGGMQTSESGRVVTLVMVCQGNVYVLNPGDTTWTAATNSTSPLESPPLNFTGVVRSAVNSQKMFFADGTNAVYYDPSDNAVHTWTPTAGSLPVDSSNRRPRLVCNWRNRLTQSGLEGDPQNWFMAKLGDPFNFDYSPVSPSPQDAVAGNNAPAGLVGDKVTGMVPYTDDQLIFGCDSQIWVMRGDPADGGRLDLVTRGIGMAFGTAWAIDADGTVWFMSNNTGIYTMTPGSQPVRVSTPIDPLLKDIDTGSSIINLVFNTGQRVMHVFVTTANAPSADTHYVWEQRSGAWWQDSFGNSNHNPVATCVFDGNEPSDRTVLVGGWDGYVRSVDPDATDDDGQPIVSLVTIGPVLTTEQDDILLHDLQAVLGTGSGNVGYEVYTGPTAEEAVSSAVAASGTWLPGRNNLSPVRRAGHAIYVRIGSASYWAIEQIRMRITGKGKVRRRSKWS